MKQFRLAWMISVILIIGVVAGTSLPYFNVNVSKPADKDSSSETRKLEMETLDIVEHPLRKEVNPINAKINLDPKLEKEILGKKKPLQGLFETRMETIKADDKLSIDFSLKNISGKNLQISYGSGQQFDIWINNVQNKEIYRWSFDKAFTQALIETDFGKSGQLTFHEEWNLKDNEGHLVPSGKYTISVRVVIGLKLGAISQDELTAKTIIEIE